MMECKAKVMGYDVCKGYPGLPVDLIEMHRIQKKFEKKIMGKEWRHRLPSSIKMEEEGMATQNISHASLLFEDLRNPIRNALRAIVRFIFEKYDLPRENGLDVGCGATGEMAEELLTINSGQKSTWTQIDINPNAVKENKKRHPLSNIQPGSYLNLGLFDRYPLITGLSCLDSTAFVERAVSQIRDTLIKGGFFLHIQDVKPGWSPPFQEVMAIKEEFPYTVEIAPGKNEEHEIFPHNVMIYHTKEGILSVMELFRRYLDRVIGSVDGLKLLENDWFTTIGPSGDPSKAYFYNAGFRCRSSNASVQIVSTIVTLAKKI